MNGFKLESEQALLATFRPRDRKRVELPPKLTFPLAVQHCFSWTHPAGGRAYVVFAVKGGVPTGIAFDHDGHGPLVPHLCDWCHVAGLGTQVGLLTARLNSKKVIGVHVCSDLRCKQRLEDEANRSGASPVPAVEKLLERMGRFAEEGLGIALNGANR